MGRPVVTTVALTTAATANGIAQAQTRVGAGALNLNGSLVSGGIATLDSGGAARTVVIHSAADDTGHTFTVTGTAPDPGNPSRNIATTSTVKGANAGDAIVPLNFVTVTGVSIDATPAGNVTVGTVAGSGPWVPWDANVRVPFAVSAAGVINSGAPTWQVDVTFDDVYNTAPNAITAWPWASLTGKNGNAFDVITNPAVRASRLTLTAIGVVTGTFTQQGD